MAPQPPSTSRRAAIGALGASLAAAPAAVLAAADPMKVVFHVSDPDAWPGAVSNLTNVTKVHPEGTYQVVVDGTAVLSLQGANQITDALGGVADLGVVVQVCPNALEEHGVAIADLPQWAKTDLGGVIALVEANRAGFVYVKP